MKKIFLPLVAVSVLLTSCISSMVGDKEVYKNATGTPENSVVFYGNFNQSTSNAFCQMNPEYPANRVTGGPIFVSLPVAPGSTYQIQYSFGSNANWYWTYYFTMQTEMNPVVVQVPEKPGLYYIGTYSSFNECSKIEEKDVKYQIYALKGVIECYEGTEWATLAAQKLEELSNEK